jgi:UPF0271 protein
MNEANDPELLGDGEVGCEEPTPLEPKRGIDLNADVGELEGADNTDALLLACVTSASVACGGHAGSESLMQRTIELALDHGVVIGAHPSYPDREGFGRRRFDGPTTALEGALLRQLETLLGVADRLGAAVRFVKPHGTLYHDVLVDETRAAALFGATQRVGIGWLLLQARDALFQWCSRWPGEIATEGFADRRYAPDGSLVARSEPGALITDPMEAASQALGIARRGQVLAVGGRPIRVAADSICVHGDSPGAATIVRTVREALQSAGLHVASFVQTPSRSGRASKADPRVRINGDEQ